MQRIARAGRNLAEPRLSSQATTPLWGGGGREPRLCPLHAPRGRDVPPFSLPPLLLPLDYRLCCISNISLMPTVNNVSPPPWKSWEGAGKGWVELSPRSMRVARLQPPPTFSRARLSAAIDRGVCNRCRGGAGGAEAGSPPFPPPPAAMAEGDDLHSFTSIMDALVRISVRTGGEKERGGISGGGRALQRTAQERFGGGGVSGEV